MSMLHSLGMEDRTQQLQLCTQQEAKVIVAMADRGINTAVSTSAGRLFDAVSAVLGICRSSTFEGEASCSLQFAAERFLKEQPRSGSAEWQDLPDVCIDENGFMILPTDLLFERIILDRCAGTDSGYLAYMFHETLARQIAAALVRGSEESGISTCALSGGVFQNTLLLKRTKELLEEQGMRVLTHHLVPPNDGGICLGQAVAATAMIRRN